MHPLVASHEYERPKSFAEFLKLISTCQNYRFIAGGTDYIPELKAHPKDTPAVLISLTGINEMKGVSVSRNILHIGAGTELSEIAEHSLIRQKLPAIATTAKLIATPAIRNRATIAGNLLVNNRCPYFNQSAFNRAAMGACFKSHGDRCHLVKSTKPGDSPLCRARFVSDMAAMLILCDSTIEIVSPRESRNIPLQDLYRTDGINRLNLANNEIIKAIVVPITTGRRIYYEKLRIRKSFEFASVGIGVAVQTRAKLRTLSVCVIGTNPAPVIIRIDEKDFSSQAQMIQAICDKLAPSIQPLKQDLFPPSYRKEMAGVLCQKILQERLI